jgi:hypothetical protein
MSTVEHTMENEDSKDKKRSAQKVLQLRRIVFWILICSFFSLVMTSEERTHRKATAVDYSTLFPSLRHAALIQQQQHILEEFK